MFYTSQSSNGDKNEQWLNDSSWSTHMKPSKNMFNNIDIKRQTRVKIENGEFTSVETTNGKQVIHEVMNVLGIIC